MASLIESLINILKDQSINYEQLLIISKEKRNCIINNDINDLKDIISAENNIIGKNQKLEIKREKIISDISNVLNQERESLTLTKILELIKNQKEYSTLLEVKNNLRNILDDLKYYNDQNKLLIESSLEYIDFSINVVMYKINDENNYYNLDGESALNCNSFFDAKS